MKKNIGILGGGLAGLAIAYFLDKEKYQLTILEKEAECGGLIRTFEHRGFYFEFGGHILFSKDQEILDFLLDILRENKDKIYRNNKIYYNGRYIRYPFENDLSSLKKKESFECLFYYLTNLLKKKPEPKNFADFLYYHFGKAITEKYLLPYNEKIWNIDSTKMSVEWAKDRLPQPPPMDVVKSALGIKTEGYKHQLHFWYPRVGGIQSLAKRFEEEVLKQGVKIIKNFEIQNIKKEDNFKVSNGQKNLEFDQIIISLPINNFFASWNKTPQEVIDSLIKLQYNSLIVVMVGIKRDKLTDKFAVYFPDRSLLFHRICFNKYLSQSMCPPGTSSVQAEITCNKGDGVYELSDEEVSKHVVDGLAREGIINKAEVITTKVVRSEYAYMVPGLDHAENKKVVYDYLAEQNLSVCGRFAEFEYYNMDAIIKSAKKLSQSLNSK